MRLRSLQLRLATRLGLAYVLAIAMAVSFFVYQAYNAAGSLSERQLGLRAADLARYVFLDSSGAPRLDLPPELAAAYAAASDADIFAIRASDGRVIARVRALLRRPGGALGVTLQAGNVSFDTIGRDVRVGTTALALPRREGAILEHLMRRLGRVIPKTVLEERRYGIDDELESNAIPVHVHHLRRKLEAAGATAEIHTVRGVGYLLTERRN